MKQYESDLSFRFAVFLSKTSSGGQRVWGVGDANAFYIFCQQPQLFVEETCCLVGFTDVARVWGDQD